MADVGVKVPAKERPAPFVIPVAPEIQVALRALCTCGQKLARVRPLGTPQTDADKEAAANAPAACLRLLMHNEPTSECQGNIPGKMVKWS